MWRRAARLVIGISVATASFGADFGLSATIRAGMWNAGDWELGIGPSGNNTAYTYNLPTAEYYPNGLPNRFEIGYLNASNTAFVRYYYSATGYRQVNYSPGGVGLGANSVWTLPAGSFLVTASSRPAATGITVDQLALSGVSVLQPFSTTTIFANQPGGASSSMSIGNDVVFRTGASGDWLLSGRIRFSGLLAYTPGGAARSHLQLLASARGTSAEVPEPATVLAAAWGLGALLILKLQRRVGKGSRP